MDLDYYYQTLNSGKLHGQIERRRRRTPPHNDNIDNDENLHIHTHSLAHTQMILHTYT